MNDLQARIETWLEQRAVNKLVRIRSVQHAIDQGRALIDAQARINFSSNDYLGLSHDKRIRRIYSQAFLNYPCGSGGSSLVTGFHKQHRDLEKCFAEFFQMEAAVFIPSGYQANLAIISSLSSFGCDWFIDKQSHASFYDGLSLAKAPFKRFRHNDIVHLRQLFKQANTSSLIMVEGVNSMTGSITPCVEISNLSQGLIVDDAHAVGILGQSGRGSTEFHGLNSESILAIVSPLGKAFNSQGAIVAGKQYVIDAIVQCARSFTYTTAPSPALAVALIKTLEIVQSLDDKREYLRELLAYFIQSRDASPWHWRTSSTPIQQLILGDNQRVCDLSDYLLKQGVWCLPMRPPTVPKEQIGLRITLTCHHSEHDINKLFACLSEFFDE